MKGTNWFNRNFRTIIYIAFLVPIVTVAIVSISHVTGWYGISNPMSWALYLSIGIEIAALSALAAISVQMGSKVYVPFGIVTIIQFVGNIFFAFEYIDIDSTKFLSWVELTGPILEYIGVEQGDLQSHRRFLAIFSGGMLPLISLSFLHMLVKFNEERPNGVSDKKTEIEEESNEKEGSENHSDDNIESLDEFMDEVSRYRPTQDELDKLDKILSNKTPEKQKKRPSKDEQRESLTQMVGESEEMGLYDEPFDNPLVKEEIPEPPVWMDEIPTPTEDDFKHYTPKNASEMMITSNEDIINSIPEDDDMSDWDVTLSDGFDEDHALDMVLNDMVDGLDIQDFEDPIDEELNVQLPDSVETAELDLDTGKINENIKNIDVVLDELPITKPNFDVNVEVEPLETPQVTLTATPSPNFIFKEPISDVGEINSTDSNTDDPEKKK